MIGKVPPDGFLPLNGAKGHNLEVRRECLFFLMCSCGGMGSKVCFGAVIVKLGSGRTEERCAAEGCALAACVHMEQKVAINSRNYVNKVLQTPETVCLQGD